MMLQKICFCKSKILMVKPWLVEAAEFYYLKVSLKKQNWLLCDHIPLVSTALFNLIKP